MNLNLAEVLDCARKLESALLMKSKERMLATMKMGAQLADHLKPIIDTEAMLRQRGDAISDEVQLVFDTAQATYQSMALWGWAGRAGTELSDMGVPMLDSMSGLLGMSTSNVEECLSRFIARATKLSAE